MSRRNIDAYESASAEHALRAIADIEAAIREWNSSEEKPARLKQKFLRYKRVHDSLGSWLKRERNLAGRKERYLSRLLLLREFAAICGSLKEDGHA